MDALRSEVVQVTPEIAEKWLETNLRNRLVNNRLVNRLSRQMQGGRWRLTHQGIAFDSVGNLVDGQHRLRAVILSGETIPMLVTHGVEDPDVLDTGKARSASDVLSMGGWKNTIYLSSALRLVHCYDHVPNRPWRAAKGNLTNMDFEDIAAEYGDLVGAHYGTARKIHLRISGGISPVMAALFVCERWSNRNIGLDLFQDYVDGLVTGVGMDVQDPRLALASWTGKARRQIVRGGDATDIAMLTQIRAFGAWATGEPLNRILVRDQNSYMYRLPGDVVSPYQYSL